MKKLTILVICLFACLTAYAQLQQTGTKEGLPVYKQEKSLIAESTKIGFLEVNGIIHDLYQKNKVNSKGFRTCFYITERVVATKTQKAGTLYRKTCLCP